MRQIILERIVNILAVLGLVLAVTLLASSTMQETVIAGLDNKDDGLECVYNCDDYELMLTTLR